MSKRDQKKYRCVKSGFQAIVIAFLFFNTLSVSATPITGASVTLDGVTKAIGLAADLVTLFGIADNDAPSNVMNLKVSGSDQDFSLTLQGGGIDDTVSNLTFAGDVFGQQMLPGGGVANVKLWSWSLIFSATSIQDTLSVNEVISINGFIQHEIGPHAVDALTGPQLTFLVDVDADDEKNNRVSDRNDAPKTLEHFKKNATDVPHFDSLRQADLVAATATQFGVFDDITQWTFQARAQHLCSKPQDSQLRTQGLAGITALDEECILPASPPLPTIPEPSTLSLLGIGILAGIRWARVKRCPLTV